MSSRKSESVIMLMQQDLNRLREFFTANATAARLAAVNAATISEHAFQTGQAAAFESAAGYCSLACITPEPHCECHERDGSYVCEYCRSQGLRGHMEKNS